MPPHTPKDTVTLLARIPATLIPARRGDLMEIYTRLKSLLDHSPHTKLLSILKYAAYIVLFINFGSLPFVWHFRVLWPILLFRIKKSVLRLKLVFASEKERAQALFAWGESQSPVGANPFETTAVYRRWAGIDDIDMFGIHLSNSSYAKAFDSARSKSLVKWFPAWGRSGGQMALGATHYHFLREIPPLVRYEVRLTIGSWDHKWLYVVARYVTLPSRRYATRPSPQSSTPATPKGGPTPANNGSANVEHAVADIINAGHNETANARRVPIIEPDGAILHCVAVSQICFKGGRITIPPAIVLASEGFTKPYGDGDGDGDSVNNASCSYSHTNPPPNWLKSQSLRVPPHGSMENFRAFHRGKWRDIPEGERWWEDALGGSIETKRQANLGILESLKLGLERTRTLHRME